MGSSHSKTASKAPSIKQSPTTTTKPEPRNRSSSTSSNSSSSSHDETQLISASARTPIQPNYKYTHNQPPIAFSASERRGSQKLRSEPGYTGDWFGQRPRNTDSLFNAVFAPPPRSDSDVERSEKKRLEKRKMKKAEKARRESLKEERKIQRRQSKAASKSQMQVALEEGGPS